MKEKNYNLELIRMISFVLVIAIHVTNYFCRAYGKIPQGEYLFSLALDTAARVSVPCFFMISGALLLGREEPVSKHISRLIRFVIVLVVWSAIYYVWNIGYMKSEYDLKDILEVPVEAHLWYLYAMIPIYIAMPFLQVLCRAMSMTLERLFLIVTTVAVLVNYGMWLIHQEPYYDFPLIGDRVYAYYLFIGYYIYKYRRHIRISQKTAVIVCIFSMAASFGITLAATTVQQDHYEGALTYAAPFIILSAVSFFLFMLRIRGAHFVPGERSRRIIDLFCSCSFGIYLIHILFLDNYKKYAEASDLSAWIAVPALIIGISGVSFVCVWGIRKFRVGRKIT